MTRRTAKEKRNLVAVTPGGDVTMDHILGFYAVSSIPDRGVSAAKLRKAWIGAGMDPALVPKNRKGVHAFQVACRSVESRRQHTNGDPEKTREVRVEEVLEDANECVYQITILRRDFEERAIDHPRGMRVVFTKKTEDISVEPLEDFAEMVETDADIEERIRQHYEANSTKVPGSKVRRAVRRTLQDVNSTIIARKMYFIPKSGRGAMDELTQALSDVYKDDEYTFYTIPVMNAPDQKAIVEGEFTKEIADRCNKLLQEATSRDEVRSHRLSNMLEEHKECRKLVEKYRDMLDSDLRVADERVLLLNEALEDMVVRAGKGAQTANK